MTTEWICGKIKLCLFFYRDGVYNNQQPVKDYTLQKYRKNKNPEFLVKSFISYLYKIIVSPCHSVGMNTFKSLPI